MTTEAPERPAVPATEPAAAAPVLDERDDLRRRWRVGAALAAPVLLLTWFPLLQFPHWGWVALALAAPVATWCALPLHRAALARLREGAATTDTLVSVTALAALGLSVHQLLTGPPGPGYAAALTAAWSGGGSVLLPLDVAAALPAAVLGARLLARVTGAARDLPGAAVPAVLLVAVAAGGFWTGGGAGPAGAGAAALAVLVAACPVAVLLAEPVALLAARRAAAWRGTRVEPDTVTGLGRATTLLVGDEALTGPVERWRRLGLDPVLLTADPPDLARARADRAGVDAVVAGLAPAEQVAAVQRLRDAGCVVAVVGGGDAVRAAADVGIALGPARDAADVDTAADLLELGRRAAGFARAAAARALAVSGASTALAAAGLLHPTAALVALLVGVVLVAVPSLAGLHARS